jgi:hypothetical protein
MLPARSARAAPSLMVEALPAVMVPSGENAGFSAVSRSISPRNGSSSVSTLSLPLLPCRETGTISSRKIPSAAARRASR